MGKTTAVRFYKLITFSTPVKISIGLGAIILYIISLLLLYPQLGERSGVISIIPASLIGWLFGFRRGLILSILLDLLTWLLYLAMGDSLPLANALFKGPEFLVVIFAGGIGGAFSDLLLHLREQSELLQQESEKRQAIATELRLQRDFFRKIMENLGQGLTLTNVKGEFRYVNRAFAEMIGRDPEQLIHRRPFEFTTPEDHRTLTMAKDRREKGQTGSYDTRLKHADGHIVNAYITGVPLWDEGQFLGSVAIVTDLTEQKKLIAELEAYAHTVAHDLKNPLTVIISYAGLLKEMRKKAPPEKIEGWVSAIHNSAFLMNKIINELLILAKINQQEVKKQPVNMSAILANIHSRLELLIDRYQATIIAPKEWPQICGHEPWVEEMLANFISNAIKYGGNPPHIELGSTLLENNMVQVWVRDNGQGISQEDQVNLFTEFTQLHQNDSENATSHGLGLSIVRRVAERLDGEVGVESEVGKGSTFFFALPSLIE